jgi:tetratricopeptide (TPR) repeat protein
MIDQLIQRATQLIEHKRYAEAERLLKDALSQEINNVDALILLSLCKSEANLQQEAIELIKRALSSQADNDYALYLHALYSLKAENYKEAEKFIKSAISFNPKSADYFGLYATLKFNQKEWQSALQLANEGLEIDPENLTSLNIRSSALFKLDKKEEAFTTISKALSQDPENDYTHTNLGWGLLEKKEYKKALEHFREALKQNPSNDSSKAGLVEALKARYIFYRIFLSYAFWIGNMKGKVQWAVIVGFYIGSRLLRIVANENETLQPFITPIIFLYTLFAVSTWIITPLSNLFLRLNVYGRYALTEDQVKTSNLVGVSLSIGVFGIIAYLFNPDLLFAMIGFWGITMMIPLASAITPPKKNHKLILSAYTIILALLGLSSILAQAFQGEAGNIPFVYLGGIFLYGWVANALIIK